MDQIVALLEDMLQTLHALHSSLTGVESLLSDIALQLSSLADDVLDLSLQL